MIGDNQLHKLTDLFAGMIGHRPTACVVTFGCQMNARDSEKLRGVLDDAGFELTAYGDLALDGLITSLEFALTALRDARAGVRD